MGILSSISDQLSIGSLGYHFFCKLPIEWVGVWLPNFCNSRQMNLFYIHVQENPCEKFPSWGAGIKVNCTNEYCGLAVQILSLDIFFFCLFLMSTTTSFYVEAAKVESTFPRAQVITKCECDCSLGTYSDFWSRQCGTEACWCVIDLYLNTSCRRGTALGSPFSQQNSPVICILPLTPMLFPCVVKMVSRPPGVSLSLEYIYSYISHISHT